MCHLNVNIYRLVVAATLTVSEKTHFPCDHQSGCSRPFECLPVVGETDILLSYSLCVFIVFS